MAGGSRSRRAIERLGALGVAVAVVMSAGVGRAGAARAAALPDYVPSTVNRPPATAQRGDTFPTTDTTTNNGGDTDTTSFNSYYLSKDPLKDPDDTLLGARGLFGLAAGASNAGGLNAHVPGDMALGKYYVLTCVDDYNQIAESDESNNCKRSVTRVAIVMPDYSVTAVDEPPASAQRGTAFNYLDTTTNLGDGDSSTTTATQYYLSKNKKKDGNDIIMAGRVLGGLAAGAASTGGVNAHVPSSTPAGYYYVITCADDGNFLAETSETNNCKTSSGRMFVTVPDLSVTSVTGVPATATRASQITVDDVVHNAGSVALSTSTSAYYLSHNNVVDESDYQLAETVTVSALPGGATEFDDDVALTIPGGTKLGKYKVIVCADSTNVLAESHETNNCRASSTKVQVVSGSRPAAGALRRF